MVIFQYDLHIFFLLVLNHNASKAVIMNNVIKRYMCAGKTSLSLFEDISVSHKMLKMFPTLAENWYLYSR